jgi:hypothetical protein
VLAAHTAFARTPAREESKVKKNPAKSVDPRVKALLVAFGTDLDTAIKLAPGRVTYRWLEKRAEATPGMRLPKASVHRLLHGEMRDPDWTMVLRILTLIDVPGDVIDNEWRQKYETLIKSIQTVGLPSIWLPGVECPQCGGAVVNENRHREYHAELEALVRRRMMRSVNDEPEEVRTA